MAALLLVVLVVAGCADDDSERRFANDPIPTEDLAAQPTQAPLDDVPTRTAAAATPIPLGQLLGLTGAANHFFVQLGTEVLSVPFDGAAPKAIFDAGSSAIVALAGSGSGERVAVVTADRGGRLAIQVLDGAGETVATAELSAGLDGSPEPTSGHGLCRIAWATDGEHLLVTLPAGGIVEVDMTGAVRQILPAATAPSPRAVAWSPGGGAIAYVDAGVGGTATGLYVGSTDALPIDPVAVIRPIEGRSRQIVEIAWPAGGAGIVYAERAPDGDLSVGGDLFAIDPNGGTPRLVASAGRVTQVGAVDRFAISPDGQAIAFSVLMVADADGVASSVLRVRQIGGPTAAELELDSGAAVLDVAWTAAGLTWVTQQPASGDATGIVLQRAEPDGSVETIYSDLPAASPVASPAASPVASPVP